MDDNPFMRLPDVLVSRIFLLATSGAARKERDEYKEGLKTMRAWAQTCKVFHQVSMDERLWARLLLGRFGKPKLPQNAYTNAPNPPPAPPVRRMPTIPQMKNFMLRQLNDQLQTTENKPRSESVGTTGDKGDTSKPKHVVIPMPPRPLPTKLRINHQAEWRDAYISAHTREWRRIQQVEDELKEHNKCSNRSGRFTRDILCCGNVQYNTYFVLASVLGIVPLLLSLLIPLALDGFITASWSVLLLPIWISALVIQIFAFCIGIDEDWFVNFEFDVEEMLEDWYAHFALCCGQLILLLFPVFVVLKADEMVEWSWAISFIPFYVVLGILEIGGCILIVSMVSDELYDWDDVEDNPMLVVIAITAILSLMSLIPFFIMLPMYIDGSLVTSFFMVCIPLWISVVLLAIPAKIVMGFYTLIPWFLLVFLPFGVTPLLIGLKIENIISASWMVTCVPVIAGIGLITIAGFIMVIKRIGPFYDTDDEYWDDDVNFEPEYYDDFDDELLEIE